MDNWVMAMLAVGEFRESEAVAHLNRMSAEELHELMRVCLVTTGMARSLVLAAGSTDKNFMAGYRAGRLADADVEAARARA